MPEPVSTALAISSILGGIFGGIGAGKQAKEGRLNREAEHRRWATADPLRQQLLQILAGKMGQASPTAQGFDFFSNPRAGLVANQPVPGRPMDEVPRPPLPGGIDPRQQLQAFLAQRMRGGMVR